MRGVFFSVCFCAPLRRERFFNNNVHRAEARAKFRRVAADVRRMVFFHREGARVPEGAGGDILVNLGGHGEYIHKE